MSTIPPTPLCPCPDLHEARAYYPFMHACYHPHPAPFCTRLGKSILLQSLHKLRNARDLATTDPLGRLRERDCLESRGDVDGEGLRGDGLNGLLLGLHDFWWRRVSECVKEEGRKGGKAGRTVGERGVAGLC